MVMALFVAFAFAEEGLPEVTREPSPSSPAQQALVQEGVALHDAGDYDGAIRKYKQVLADTPNEVSALLEISLSYFEKKDYENALAFAKQGAEIKSGLLPGFYMTIGSILDETGKGQDALAIYKTAIERFPNVALLHYNMAVSLLKSGKQSEARNELEESLVRDPNHASSHALLGQLYHDTGYRIPAVLALSRFLVLEPESPRAQGFIPVLQQLITGNVSSGRGRNKMTITVDPNAKKDEGDYGAIELGMAMSVAVAATKEGKNKSAFESLVTTYKIIGELMSATAKEGTGFAATYYGPYFGEMVARDHVHAFVFDAWRSSRLEGAADWRKRNEAELQKFEMWSRAYRWKDRK
jgi:tetratricopeptide (TPR) repeat protein